MAEIKNNENLTASLSLSAEIQSKEEILKGKIASSILYFKGENGKSPYIGNNGNWFIYDDEKKEWVDTTINATVDLSEYYTKTETDDKIKEVSDWINEQINKFYTKEEIDKKFENLDRGKEDKSNKVRQVEEEDLDTLTEEQYLSAKASATLIRGLRNAIDEKSDLSKEDIEEMLSDTFDEINQNINKKADSADSLEGYGIKDAYNKEEIDSKIQVIEDTIEDKPDGDMKKSIYDKDNDGIVDKANSLTEGALSEIHASIYNTIEGRVSPVEEDIEEINAELVSLGNISNSAYTIAAGANRAKTFRTYKEFINWVNSKEVEYIFQDPAFIDTYLPIGNNILIEEVEVPDLFIAQYSEENGFEDYYDESGKDDELINKEIINLLSSHSFFNTKWLRIGQLETQKVDLTEYVKNTDYATSTTAGVVKGAGNYGTGVRPDGSLALQAASVGEIKAKKSYYKPITPYRADKTVQQSTHQNLSDDYSVESLIVSNEFTEDKGTLPVSYNATKNYVDLTIEQVNSELNEREFASNKVTTIDEMSISQGPTYPTAKAVFDFVNDKIDNIENNGSGGGGNTIDVVDNLESTDSTKALSANQGRILNEKITNLEETSAESNMPAIEVQLNETIPEGSLSSICDFEFKPTTPLCIYNLHDSNVRPNGQYFGQEIPFLTTTGSLVVKDSNDNIKIKKYIDSMINIVNDTYKWNVSDILTQNGLFKAWSGKFYLTMSEYTKRVDSGSTNSVYTFEFNESDFSKTGIPAKVDNIPIASPCFYPGTSNGTLFGGDPFKLKFFYNKETNKYVMEIRGYVQDNIFPQLQSYSKAYIYYQLETPYYEKEFLALGLEAGDKILFEHDYSYIQKYLDTNNFFKNGTDSGNLVINPDTTPMFIAKIPQNTKDALNGFNNAAKIFNEKESSASEEVAQDYSWIGDGDGTTDYTRIIQNKIKELKSLSDGGTIYLGNGVYNISNFIEVYDNIKIIGTGNTVIQQTNKNTHMIIISGSNIMLKDLKLKLYAMSNEEKDNLEYNTELTACVYINSNNHKEYEWYDNRYLDNIYCKNLVMENIYLLGSYGFKYVDGKPSISNDYEHYRGCGLIQNNLFFNYASLSNIHINGMYHGLHGVGGSNDITIFCEACKTMVHGGGGYVNLNIYGHSYYSEDANGNTISMSDEIGYFTNMEQSCIAEYVYDVQWMKNIFIFEGLSMNNRYIASQYGGASYFANYDKGNIKLQKKIIDYGRGNRAVENFQNSPYHIGLKYIDQASQTSFKQNDPITQNVLSGAGVWGAITSNDAFNQGYLNLSDICRYPKPFQSTEAGIYLRSAISEHSPTEENPIEILIDVSNRPINSIPGCFIQFDHSRIASDFKISFDITNTNIFTKEINVVNNMDVVWYFMQHQSLFNIIYKIKIVITKALYLESLKYQDSGYTKHEIEYNPDKKVGICNIGMIDSDFAGRAFLGECGGNVYGNLLLNKNSTIKNVPTPIDEGDAVNKKYADSVIGENKEDKSNRVSSGLALHGNDYHEDVSDDKYPTTKLVHEWAMEGYSLGSIANQRLDENYYTKEEIDDIFTTKEESDALFQELTNQGSMIDSVATQTNTLELKIGDIDSVLDSILALQSQY